MAADTRTSGRRAPSHLCALALAMLLAHATAFLPAQNPPWPPQYALINSTISMACNSSGWYNATVGGQFGIVSYDWSNAKAQWANAQPMDCEERLVTQAAATKAASPNAHVFVYRNLVKALPWFSSVREKLTDPAYAGFFLRFKPGGYFPNGSYHVPNCDNLYDPPLCSTFYHDQEQTPEHPTPSDPNPDGVCDALCDCGGVPCGEYLFNHANGSQLTEWLVQEYILGPTALGNPAIDGLFIDDFWCSNILNGSGACTDPVQGPTEIDPNNQADMGLSDEAILTLTQGWLSNMAAVQAAILKAGGYTWSLIPGQANANAMPFLLNGDNCVSFLRQACDAGKTPWQTAPLLFGFTTGNQTVPFPQLAADIAAFQLARGPHAYLGWGVWGMTWPVGVSWNNQDDYVLPLPQQLYENYGVPEGLCTETVPGSSEIFTRRWTNATVELNCKTMTSATAWRT